MTERPVYPANSDAQGAMALTLANAFQDDPSMVWMFPDAEKRQRRLPKLFALMTRLDLDDGLVLVSPDAEVVTMWRRPGQTETTTLTIVRNAFALLRIFTRSLGRALAINAAIDAHHPKGERFWYLHFIGTRPDAQGKGWGGAAIRAGMERAHADRLPIYLETATADNVGLYLRLGFTIVEEWDVPRGGPHFWSMIWRP